MKIISLFNNKGGVGKSTLAFHLSNILSDRGLRTLMIDLDPQCNLTIFGMDEEKLHSIWEEEDPFIEDYESAMDALSSEEYEKVLSTSKTIHFLLKPAEDGQGELESLPPPVNLSENLHLIPGRLTIHQYENKISERWSGAYQGDSLSIRTITNIRRIAQEYHDKFNYDFIIIDTSPSLGALNKVVISTVDGFIIPALPDMFSLYGIRNIGSSLKQWSKEFHTILSLISDDKRSKFPENFVRFLGYTIYNAKKYTGTAEWNLAKAHFNYAIQIPETINKFIASEFRDHLTGFQSDRPIGLTAVMHSHNTLPAMAQKYKTAMWNVPFLDTLEPSDKGTVAGNRGSFEATKTAYSSFADEFLERIETLR